VSQGEHENNGSSFGRSEQILKECLHNLLMVSDERLLIAAMLPMSMRCCPISYGGMKEKLIHVHLPI